MIRLFLKASSIVIAIAGNVPDESSGPESKAVRLALPFPTTCATRGDVCQAPLMQSFPTERVRATSLSRRKLNSPATTYCSKSVTHCFLSC